MADLVFGKLVKVVSHGKDRYGRVIGDVIVRGKLVNEIMVRQGWAWNFVKYSKSPLLAQLERQARAERRRLWVDGLCWWELSYSSSPTTATDPEFFLHKS